MATPHSHGPVGTRPVDPEFIKAMEHGLEHGRRMGRKGWDSGWEEESSHTNKSLMDHLVDRLNGEFDELIEAVDRRATHKQVTREAADVANIAMMIQDLYAALYTHEEES